MAQKTALLTIDMQNVFFSMVEPPNPAIPNILALSKFFTTNNLNQLFTQHGHPPEHFKPPIKNQLVLKWGDKGSIHTNTPDWELIPEIEELITKDIPVVGKTTYDGFIHTDLEERLRKKGIERVVVCGVMTDCCVDTTARSAFNRGFETWVVKDATASANKTQHERGLGGFGFGFGEVLGTEEVIQRLKGELS